MRPRARVIAEPNAKVLHAQGTAFVDDVHADNLAIRLFDLLELAQEVPETRFCDDFVDGEDAHTVELGGRVGLCRQVAANDLVFLEAHLKKELDVSFGSKTIRNK